jgi:hypothetical protein
MCLGHSIVGCVFCKAEARRIIFKALYQLNVLHLEILINLPSSKEISSSAITRANQ